MGEIAARLADRTYVTTDNPRSEDPAAIVDEIVAGIRPAVTPGGDVVTVLDRRAAIRAAIAGARSGDVVRRGRQGPRDRSDRGGETTPFDDRARCARRAGTRDREDGAPRSRARRVVRWSRGRPTRPSPRGPSTRGARRRRLLRRVARRPRRSRLRRRRVRGAARALRWSRRRLPPSRRPRAPRSSRSPTRSARCRPSPPPTGSRSELRVVAVAGSTGKTSTKDLLAAALAPLGCYASPASHNNEFGLPITLLNAPADVSVVVAEMGERFPGDVKALCEIARPQIGVVTNVGLAHAEHLGGAAGAAAGDRRTDRRAPRRRPRGAQRRRRMDACARSARDVLRSATVTVGASAGADYRIEESSSTHSSIRRSR